MSPRELALAEGPKWEGARFHRGQRLPYSHGDCCAILWGVYIAYIGRQPWESYARFPATYRRICNGQWEWWTQREFLLECLAEYMPELHEIPIQQAMPGDWLTTGAPGQPSNHLALILPDQMVLHARMDPKRTPAGASIMRERQHEAFKKTIRKAFTLETL